MRGSRERCRSCATVSRARVGPMTDRDDREWLLARERGEDVSHIPEDTRARYRELGQLIVSLPGRSPSPGWKQRTLAAIDQPVPPPVAELEPPEPSQLEKRVSSQPAPPPVAELEPLEPSQLEKLVSSQPAPLTPEQPERPAPPRVRRRPRW